MASPLIRKAVVGGGGVGGLTAALALIRTGWHVTVLEANVISPTVLSTNTVGLWGPSLRCLAALGVLPKIEDQLTFVGRSGYRSVSGTQLAAPKVRLDQFDVDVHITPSPTLAFVDESHLTNALLNEIDSSNIRFNERIVEAQIEDSSITLTTSTKSNFEATVVIAADGSHSTLRQLLGSDKATEPDVASRNYTVFRGRTPLLDSGDRISEPGFQTWGVGARFACVPTHDGNAWFAAISNSLLQQHPNAVFNNDTAIPTWILPIDALSRFFEFWHNPIQTLIGSTKNKNKTGTDNDDCVVGLDAVATKTVSTRGFSSFMPSGCALCCIGDAGHTLDPILAQGAGVAIEDAVKLATLLNQSIDHDCVNNNHPVETPDEIHPHDIKIALEHFDRWKLQRVSRLHMLSNLAQGVGHLDSRLLCQARDFTLNAIPSVLKSVCFDHFVDASLSGATLFQPKIYPVDPALEFMKLLEELHENDVKKALIELRE